MFEKRINLLFYLLSALLMGPLIYASFSPIYSGDVFWHLKSGEDFVFNGLNPYFDHYTVDHFGKSIANFTVVFDAFLAIFYKFFGGEHGLQWYRLCLLSLPFCFLGFTAYRRKLNGVHLFWALSLVVFIITYRKMVRPELGGYLFTVVTCLGLFVRNYRRRYLIGLSALVVLWIHVHSTAIFAYVIGAGVYLNYFINAIWVEKKDGKYLASLVGLGLLMVLASFITLNPEPVVFHYLNRDARFQQWIVEMIPAPIYKRTFTYQYIWYAGLGVFFLSLYRRNAGAVLTLLVFLWQGYTLAKLTPHIGLVSGTLGLFLLASLPRIEKNFLRWGLASLLVGLSVLQVGSMIKSIGEGGWQTKNLLYAPRFPTDIYPQMQKANLKGKAINSYLMGGFLSHRFAPDLKIYIDGRTAILFDYDFFTDYVTTARSVDEFMQLQKEKNFDYAIGYLTHTGRLIDTALESRLFGLSIVGSRNAVLEPIAKSQYPKTSYFFRFPQCMKEPYLQDFIPEILKGKKELSLDSQLRFFFKTMVDFYQAKDRKQYLKSVLEGPPIFNVSLRFAAYRALELGMVKEAIALFAKNKEKYKGRDLILIVDLLCKYAKCKGAYPFYLKSVDKVMPNWKRKILIKQYEKLEKNLGPNFGSAGALAKVKERLVLNPDEPPGYGGRPNPCMIPPGT